VAKAAQNSTFITHRQIASSRMGGRSHRARADLRNVGAEAAGSACGRVAWRRPPAHGREERRRGQERHCVEPERHRRAGDEEVRAQGLGGELVPDHERGHQPGIGPLQMLIGHQRGHDRGVGRVDERLAGAEQEEHGVDQRDRDAVRGHGGGERGERRRPAEIDHDHEAAALEPVHVRAAYQGDQQPGQLVHERRTRDKTGITGELRDKQRAGDHGNAVADVGDCAGGPDLGEVRTERGTGGQGSPRARFR
jgi:hypothetical protein